MGHHDTAGHMSLDLADDLQDGPPPCFDPPPRGRPGESTLPLSCRLAATGDSSPPGLPPQQLDAICPRNFPAPGASFRIVSATQGAAYPPLPGGSGCLGEVVPQSARQRHPAHQRAEVAATSGPWTPRGLCVALDSRAIGSMTRLRSSA